MALVGGAVLLEAPVPVLTQFSCFRGLGLAAPVVSEARHSHRYPPRRAGLFAATSVPTSFQLADAEFVLGRQRVCGSWVHASEFSIIPRPKYHG